MKKILFQTLSNLFLMAIVFRINAQSPSSSKIYMPLDIRQAYEKGTRTYEGLPGKNFWQNTCIYKIQAEMNPYTRELNGKEWIEYFNNSPDTIKHIFFNTYQDAYKKGSQRSADIDQETKGVVIGSIVIDGDTLKEKDYYQRFTFLYNILGLKKSLNPHSSSKIEITWKIQILEKAISREGFVDSTSAFVGLWYPKICVYDDLLNWNFNIYNLKDEFYSPLSTYNVSISIPKGFLVWATGKLQNQENYSKLVQDNLNNVFSSTGIVSVIDSTTNLNYKEIGKEPWNFHADSVPDFAFGFSNHYLWDATTLNLGTRKVLISTVYPKKQFAYFKDITKAVKNAMEIYSLENPGISFPYPCFTSFFGSMSGGMEYPMMSFDGTLQNTILDAYVTIHEMLHSYVPFYLRTNETKFGWMDEGMTDFYTFKMLKKLNYDTDTLYAFFKKYEGHSLMGIGNLPLFTPSSDVGLNNYSGVIYKKPVQMLTTLEDFLGPDLWQKCFAAFLQTWKYKAPMPYDFMFFVENYTKKDLFWFWDAWFMHFGYPDLSIQKVDKDKVIIENKGGLPIPFTLQLTDKNGKQKEILFHADSWSMSRLFDIKLSTLKLSKIEVKCELVNDYNLKDNVWKK